MRTKGAVVIGLFFVLTALMAGAGGDCDFGSSADCLFFCS
jgi:hypothetical protein